MTVCEKRVEKFFLNVAAKAAEQIFVFGGNGWQDRPMPPNINYIGHVLPKDHNALNSSPKAVLNIAVKALPLAVFRRPPVCSKPLP